MAELSRPSRPAPLLVASGRLRGIRFLVFSGRKAGGWSRPQQSKDFVSDDDQKVYMYPDFLPLPSPYLWYSRPFLSPLFHAGRLHGYTPNTECSWTLSLYAAGFIRTSNLALTLSNHQSCQLTTSNSSNRLACAAGSSISSLGSFASP